MFGNCNVRFVLLLSSHGNNNKIIWYSRTTDVHLQPCITSLVLSNYFITNAKHKFSPLQLNVLVLKNGVLISFGDDSST